MMSRDNRFVDILRYMVKDVLQHEFFAEEGVIVDVTHSEESPDKLVIRMKVQGETKKKNGEEAIEFPYDLKRDDVEEIVGEMVGRHFCDIYMYMYVFA